MPEELEKLEEKTEDIIEDTTEIVEEIADDAIEEVEETKDEIKDFVENTVLRKLDNLEYSVKLILEKMENKEDKREKEDVITTTIEAPVEVIEELPKETAEIIEGKTEEEKEKPNRFNRFMFGAD
jgi:hypothetical protein